MNKSPLKTLNRVLENYPEEWIAPGNAGCPGCGAVPAVRLAMKILGPDTWGVMTTGCMAVNYTVPGTGVARSPWIHPLFGNAPSVASGLAVALKRKKLADKVNLLVVGGDGATADIGFQALSSAFHRGHKFIYLCYDNQGYQNTGGQSSGTTQLFTRTKSTPKGSLAIPKNLPEIFRNHPVSYLATASIGYPIDFMEKILKAKHLENASYIQISTPCIPAWGIESSETLEVARKAVTTGYEILYEYEAGEHTLSKPSQKYKDKSKREPITNFLKMQSRFSHILNDSQALNLLQEGIESQWKKFI